MSMQLRVVNGDSDKIYSLPGKESVSIGRSGSCDIRLLVDGVSRRHLEVIHKGGDYYVVDKGSTNGTFVNDQQVELNELIPFNTFFPVRLGHNVYLHLIDEVPDDVNRSILAQRKSEVIQPILKENLTKEKKESVMKGAILGLDKASWGIILVGLATITYFSSEIWMPLIFPEVPIEIINQKVDTSVKSRPEVVRTKANLDNEIKSNAAKIINTDKCLLAKYKKVCDFFKSSKERSYLEGFTEFGNRLYLVLTLAPVVKELTEKKFEYTPEEIDRLKLYAKRARPSLNVLKFEQEDRLVFSENFVPKNLSKVAFVYELLSTGLLQQIKEARLNDLVIVSYITGDGVGVYEDHYVVDLKKLESLRAGELMFAIKAKFRSGIDTPLERVFGRL